MAAVGHRGRDAGGVADEVEGRQASALNAELTALLVDTGRRMGFDVRTEYVLPGGRLDVVWLWSPPTPIPGVGEPLPVVAFEVESSWRTRKHVKGDLLNLQDAAVSLGVIVLAGADARTSRCVGSPLRSSIVPLAGSSCGLKRTCGHSPPASRPRPPSPKRLPPLRPPPHLLWRRLLLRPGAPASSTPAGIEHFGRGRDQERRHAGDVQRDRTGDGSVAPRLVSGARRSLARLPRQRCGQSDCGRRLARERRRPRREW